MCASIVGGPSVPVYCGGLTGSGVMRLAGRPKRPQEPHVGIVLGVHRYVSTAVQGSSKQMSTYDQSDDSS